MKELGIMRGIRDGARVTEALTTPVFERLSGPVFRLAAGKVGTRWNRWANLIAAEYKAAKEDEEKRK